MAKLNLEEGKIYCAQCDKEMNQVILPHYEFEEGVDLHRVQAYKCHSCNNLFFTEEQAKELEARTNELKEYSFGFKKKLTISGRSLVLNIPVELADHAHLKAGTPVKIVPLSNERFLVRKIS